MRNWTKEQQEAVIEAAEDLESRFNKSDHHPDEDTFPVGWLSAAQELRFLVDGEEKDGWTTQQG